MRKDVKSVIGAIGIIVAVVGLTGTIPASIQQNSAMLIGSAFMVIFGMVLLIFGFSD